jgi:hypothetical protein
VAWRYHATQSILALTQGMASSMRELASLSTDGQGIGWRSCHHSSRLQRT